MMSWDLKILEEVKICPHCNKKLTCCEAPQIHVGDGLGWGSEVLFICLNDECSLFVKGFDYLEEKFGHRASYRYMELPGSKESNVMMVGNKNAFKGSIIDPEVIRQQNKRYRKEKAAREALKTCLEEKNLEPVLTLLLDEAAMKSARVEALDYLARLNDIACIDPLRNHTFRDSSMEQSVNMILQKILQANYKKECPFCAEIIKSQAKLCMHCGKEV